MAAVLSKIKGAQNKFSFSVYYPKDQINGVLLYFNTTWISRVSSMLRSHPTKNLSLETKIKSRIKRN